MEILFPQDIHIGMKVYHTLIDQKLKVVDDKEGPAFTGKDFRDDVISYSYARMEAEFGNLMSANI